jgi:hypothetical protein
MKNLLIIILLISGNCFGQVPADSLTGTYAGTLWWAPPTIGSMVAVPDTLFVTEIDSVNCLAKYSSTDTAYYNLLSSEGRTYYTDYFSCNATNPINKYMKFYCNDSVRIISYYHLQWNPFDNHKFYGKRISGSVPTNVRLLEILGNNNIRVFPNPAKDKIEIRLPKENGAGCINIYDIKGQLAKSFEIRKDELNSTIILNIEKLSEGFYFLSISVNNKCFNTKFIKEK